MSQAAPSVAPAIEKARDEQFMRLALDQAHQAAARGEVPVGAVIVSGDDVVGAGSNGPIGAADPTAHAEIVAIRRAASRSGNYRLTGATIYVTVEPCLMCVGALVHARVGRLVYGAPEPKAGAVVSAMRALDHPALNHRVEAAGGVLEDECRELLQSFFRTRRTAGPLAAGEAWLSCDACSVEEEDRQPVHRRPHSPCGEVPKWS